MYIQYRRNKIDKKYWELQEKRGTSMTAVTPRKTLVGNTALKEDCKPLDTNKTVLKIFNPND